MLALISVWMGLISLILSLGMVLYRPWFNDAVVFMDMYLTSPLALTFAGMVLWSTRRQQEEFAPVRLQAKAAIGLTLPAVAIVYLLLFCAQQVGSS